MYIWYISYIKLKQVQILKNYKLIRSKRKSISLCVSNNLEIIVKSPINMKISEIEIFILKHNDWIETQIEKISNRRKVSLSDDTINRMKSDAKLHISARVLHFSKIMNLYPTCVKITSANTRWGSCSYKNSLCFTYKIILLSNC